MAKMSKRPLPKPSTLPKARPSSAKKPATPTQQYKRKLSKMSPDQLLNEGEDAIGDANLDAGYSTIK